MTSRFHELGKPPANKVNAAEVAERLVRELPMSNEGLSEAGLYGVIETGETFQISSDPDVYKLLEQNVTSPLKIVGLAITTSGWAAPLNADGEMDCPPSEHPDRKRVLLVAVVTADELMSSMRFADSEEVITEENGSGSLADALCKAFERIADGNTENSLESPVTELQIPVESRNNRNQQLKEKM